MIISKDKLKQPEILAAFFAFFGGILIHLFALANVVHNSDDIASHPSGYGVGVASGRWLLTILGDFLIKQKMNYNLNWMNGAIFLGFIAIAAALIVAVFHIKSRQASALLGLVLVSFPTVCSTMLYKYTAGYYGLAFLLSVAAVWVHSKSKWGFVLSALFTALSLGIYQAYLPVTAALFVLKLGQQTLEEDAGPAELLVRSIKACLSLVFGLVLYYIGVKLSLAYYDVALGTYQGIDKMGQISLWELPKLILRTYHRFLVLPFKDYCNLAPNRLMKWAYLILYALTLGSVITVAVHKKKKIGNIIIGLLLCAAFPIAVNLIEIMCPTSRIYTLMVYSCVVPILAPLAILELLPKESKLYLRLAKVSAALLLLFVFGNAYFSNVTYTSTYYVNRQTENYMASLVAQVRMTEGFDPHKEWLFVGKNSDPMIDHPWQKVPLYGGAEGTNRMISAYSWQAWITQYLGYKIPVVNSETAEAIKQTEAFIQMPCWPSEGSVQVINDVIVIKFQEQ